MEKLTTNLIECVEKHPILYDYTDPNYKITGMKMMIWREIGKELNENADALKTKWKSLRDNYVRYKKHLKKSPKKDGKKVKKWLWSSQLKFLDNCLVPPNRKPRRPPVRFTFKHSQRSLKEKTVTPILEELPQKNQEVRCIGEDATNNMNKRDCDAVDHLFLSYAETFKKFTERNQVLLKLELSKLFAETELKEIEERAINHTTVNFCDVKFVDRHSRSFSPIGGNEFLSE